MEIFAHRGFWTSPEEKNTLAAFEKAIDLGFSIETDFRDFNGDLVITHDLPNASTPKAEELGNLLQEKNSPICIAMNIKSDGLHSLVKEFISTFKLKNYFVFDMSIPDMRGYFNLELNTLSRLSEYETYPIFENQTSGIWLDAFVSTWFEISKIKKYLDLKKKVIIVSSELHGRPHLPLWNMIKNSGLIESENLGLCTDHPLPAENFFNAQN